MSEPQIRTYLQKITSLVPEPLMPIERFLLQHGSLMVAHPRARSVVPKLRKPKECFKNAGELALRRSYWLYAEGLIMTPKLPFPVLHGWLSVDGLVVDPTIGRETENEYFGVEFPQDLFINEVYRLEHWGVLDSPTGPNFRLFERWGR